MRLSHSVFAVFCVGLGLLLTDSAGANPDYAVFYAPHGRMELIDLRAASDWAKSEPDAVVVSDNVTFNVTYQDPNGVGFNDGAFGANMRTRLEEALIYVGDTLNMPGELDVLVDQSLNVSPGPLASAGTLFSFIPGFTNGAAFERLSTGSKPFAGQPEIRVEVNLAFNWNLGTGLPNFNEFDFFTVMIHEIAHGMGFLSLMDAAGASRIAPGVYTVWDGLLFRRSDGRRLLNVDTRNFQAQGQDLVSAAVGMDGIEAFAQYAQGDAPAVFAPNPFQPGSSMGHWETGGIVGGAVMEAQLRTGVIRREFLPVDLGAFVDIGYTSAQLPDGGGGNGETVNVLMRVRVQDADALLPVENATIVLQPINEQFTSNTGGVYEFFVFESGVYSLRVSAPGYRTELRSGLEVDGAQNVIDLNIQPEPQPLPRVAVTPNLPGGFEFGEIQPGQSVTRNFTGRNDGGGQLAGRVSVTGSAFSLEGAANYRLAASQSHGVTVRFNPPGPGEFAGSITFSGGDNGPVLTTLRGVAAETAQPPPPPSNPPNSGCSAGAGASAGAPWADALIVAAMLAFLFGASRRGRQGGRPAA